MKKLRLLAVAAVLALSALGSTAPASATSCYIGDDVVAAVQCGLYGTPMSGPLCDKTPVC